MGSQEQDGDGKPPSRKASVEPAKTSADPKPQAKASTVSPEAKPAADKPAAKAKDEAKAGSTPNKEHSDKKDSAASGDEEEGPLTLRRTRSSARETKPKRGAKDSQAAAGDSKQSEAAEQEGGAGPAKRPKREAAKPPKPRQKRGKPQVSTDDASDESDDHAEDEDVKPDKQAGGKRATGSGGRHAKRPRVEASTAKPNKQDSKRRGSKDESSDEEHSDQEAESSSEEQAEEQHKRARPRRGGSPEPSKPARGRGGRGRGGRGRGDAGKVQRPRRRLQSVDDGSDASQLDTGKGAAAAEAPPVDKAGVKEEAEVAAAAEPPPPAARTTQEPLPDPTSPEYQQLSVEGKFIALSKALDSFNQHWEAAARSAQLVDKLVRSWFQVPFTTDSFIVNGKAIPKEMQGIAKRKESLLGNAATQSRQLVKVWRYMSESNLTGSADEHQEAVEGHTQRHQQHQQQQQQQAGGGEGGTIVGRVSTGGGGGAAGRPGRLQPQGQLHKPGGSAGHLPGSGSAGHLPGRSSLGTGAAPPGVVVSGHSPDDGKVQAGQGRGGQQQGGVSKSSEAQRLPPSGASLHQLRSPVPAPEAVTSPTRNGVYDEQKDGRRVGSKGGGLVAGKGQAGGGQEGGDVVTVSGFVSRQDMTRDASVCMLTSCLTPPPQHVLTPLEVALQLEQLVHERCSEASAGDEYARYMHILWGLLSEPSHVKSEGQAVEAAGDDSIGEMLLAGHMTVEQLVNAIRARIGCTS